MYETIQIQNFRLFSNLTLSGLSTVNLFVGQNHTGKTSLLEAILLLSRVPVEEVVAGLRGEQDRNYWKSAQYVLGKLTSLFQNPEREIHIRAINCGVEHSLRVHSYSILENEKNCGSLTSDEGATGKVFCFTYEPPKYDAMIVALKDKPLLTARASRAQNVSFRSVFAPFLEFSWSHEEASILYELYQASGGASSAMDIGIRLLQSRHGLLMIDENRKRFPS